MHKIIPIIFVAAMVLVGCHSPSMLRTKTAAPTVATSPLAAAPTAATPVPTTPSQMMSENVRLGELGTAFIVILTVLALMRRH